VTVICSGSGRWWRRFTGASRCQVTVREGKLKKQLLQSANAGAGGLGGPLGRAVKPCSSRIERWMIARDRSSLPGLPGEKLTSAMIRSPRCWRRSGQTSQSVLNDRCRRTRPGGLRLDYPSEYSTSVSPARAGVHAVCTCAGRQAEGRSPFPFLDPGVLRRSGGCGRR